MRVSVLNRKIIQAKKISSKLKMKHKKSHNTHSLTVMGNVKKVNYSQSIIL